MNRYAFAAFLSLTHAIAAAEQPKVVAYFAEWNRNYRVQDIPADQLTHVNYAFAKIIDGQCAISDRAAALDETQPAKAGTPANGTRGKFNQLALLKKAHPHLKTLISVGGWTYSGQFSDAAVSSASRTRFARSCLDFIKKYEFDGVDLDWEYPGGGGMAGSRTRKEDSANFTLLLAEIRSQFDAAEKADHRHYLLTFASAGGPSQIGHLELAKIARSLDWFNVMTYDFHGSWDARSNFNSPLYRASDDPGGEANSKLNCDAAISAYLAGGVPAEKLVMGVPFYGRGWAGVKAAGFGLFQGKAGGSGNRRDLGSLTYHNLAAQYIGKYERHWHDQAKVPWLFDPKTGNMISYDDPQSIGLKAEYARAHKLGGIMIWEISQDDANHSLISAIDAGLRSK
jgi:chitinase